MKIQYETVTREAAGSTNLSRTTYAQTYSTAGHYSQQIRTEECTPLGKASSPSRGAP